MNFTVLLALIAGAVGGNFAGGVVKPLNLGLLGNSLVGAIGGFMSLIALEAIMGPISTGNDAVGRPGANTSTVILVVFAAGCFGAILTMIIGFLRNLMNRN